MADYYPLLAKALAGLPNTTTPAARQAIYDRARKALIGQLRSLKPPLAEDVIAREEAALDAAVARLEGERGAPVADDASLTPSPEPAPRPAPPSRPPSAGQAPGPSIAAPARSAPPAPPNRPTVAPAAPRTPTPAPPAPRYAPPPRPPSAPTAPTRPVVSRSTAPAAPTAAVRAEPPPLATTSAARVAAAPPPQIQGPAAEPEEYDDQAPPIAAETYENASAPPVRPIGDSGRPAAPGMNPPRPSRPWLWISLALFAIVVVASAAFAFLWREKPSDLAINDNTNKAPVVDSSAKNAAGQNKIAERVSGGDATPNQPPSQSSPAAPSNPPGAPASPSPAPGAPNANGETPIPTVTVPTVPMHANDAGNTQTATANPPGSNAPAQSRAALLIETPNDPQKPKVDIGTAVWTLLPAASGPAQAAGPAVQAEIDIPDMKMHATMTIRKNVDASLPATHTIDLRFTFADGADAKGFKDMALPQLRRDDTPTGDAVSGVRVKINDAYYLVGLTRSDADTTRNLDLLSSRNWLDFPLLFNDDHVAKLTFEKGATGQSVIAQAIDAWK
jgi:hypothetical protein